MNRIVRFFALFLIAGTCSAGAQSPFVLGPYDYDGSGNVIGIGTDALYRYDAYGRLQTSWIDINGTSHAQQFSYDRFGNITAVETDGTPIVLGVDAATNRLKLTSDSGIYGEYDADGNMTAYSGSMTFTPDELGMIRRATVDGQTKVYLYTADDERIAAIRITGPSQAETTSTWTLRDLSGKVLRTYQKTLPGGERWEWKEDHIYRAGALLAADVPTAEGTRRHFHVDHLGTPRLITDAQGLPVSEHTYAPFGVELTTAGPERMKFTGHERDSANLDYMHARYYTPGGGRFLSVDPVLDIKRSIREPQSWNRYSYGINNPINRIDPDGRMDGNGMGEPAEWRCPGCTRAEQLEQSNQIAAGTAGLAAAFGSLFIPGPEDVAIGAFVASRAGGAVVRFFGRWLARGDGAADALKLSRYDNVTTGRSILNRSTNVSRADFGKNLQANGFTRAVSKDGKVTIYEKDGVKYTVRDSSKSTGGPTAEVFKDGKLVQKIRLEVESK